MAKEIKSHEEILTRMRQRASSNLKGVEFTNDDAEDVILLVLNNSYTYDEAIDIVLNGIANCLDMNW